MTENKMVVVKRSGKEELFDLSKITKAIQRAAKGLTTVDPLLVATKTIGKITGSPTTRQLDEISIQVSSELISTNSEYSKLAAALLKELIYKDVRDSQILNFETFVKVAQANNLFENTPDSLLYNKINNAIRPESDNEFEYYALKQLSEKLLKVNGKYIETPQFFFMRQAIANTPSNITKDVIKRYRLYASGALRYDQGEVTAVDTTQTIIPRQLAAGMGQAVAERTILRKKDNGEWESWGDVAARVAAGNAGLVSTERHPFESEKYLLEKYIASGALLMSGRHLQHGDENQINRNMEIFTNCSSASASFLTFYLLLNGSGVGRAYDDDMMLVNWDNSPSIRCVLDTAHKDYVWGTHESVRDAKHKYANGTNVIWHEVDDSREGWAKALELWEVMTFEKIHSNKMIIFDFSKVRPNGSPIGGMQDRPASGPVPLMNAFLNIASLKGAGLAPWKQAMFVDHYMADCVLCGGVRRSARMATKYWRDLSVLDFIQCKRPIEFYNKSANEVTTIKKEINPLGFLWSSNNSITVDTEFWNYVNDRVTPEAKRTALHNHAIEVFNLATLCAYGDGTGEPGFINVDKLVQKDTGLAALSLGEYVGSKKFKVSDDANVYLMKLLKQAKKKKYYHIVNPCGEISFAMFGAYCTIADGVPYFTNSLDEAEECFRAATRALIRVNTMDSLYNKEVKRTNRIGVGITGVHEFAWKFFGYGFYDLIDEERSKDFWLTLARFNRAVWDEAQSYSKELGVNVPHTVCTIKPAGTTSKLFGLTEGWHLPAKEFYLRWVQFRNDDPLVNEYEMNGYPVRRNLKTYSGSSIVGFPTAPLISTLGMGDKLVVAPKATPEEQYQWIRLGEKYWIDGTDAEGNPVPEKYGNQISFTLKYFPDKVSLDEFQETIRTQQSTVKCCSVMPQEDGSSYEYQPEEIITKAEYDRLIDQLNKSALKKSDLHEDISFEHLACEGGACPIDFNSGSK